MDWHLEEEFALSGKANSASNMMMRKKKPSCQARAPTTWMFPHTFVLKNQPISASSATFQRIQSTTVLPTMSSTMIPAPLPANLSLNKFCASDCLTANRGTRCLDMGHSATAAGINLHCVAMEWDVHGSQLACHFLTMQWNVTHVTGTQWLLQLSSCIAPQQHSLPCALCFHVMCTATMGAVDPHCVFVA